MNSLSTYRKYNIMFVGLMYKNKWRGKGPLPKPVHDKVKKIAKSLCCDYDQYILLVNVIDMERDHLEHFGVRKPYARKYDYINVNYRLALRFLFAYYVMKYHPSLRQDIFDLIDKEIPTMESIDKTYEFAITAFDNPHFSSCYKAYRKIFDRYVDRKLKEERPELLL